MLMKLISLIFSNKRKSDLRCLVGPRTPAIKFRIIRYYFILKTSYNSFRDDYAAGFFIFAASS